MKSGCSNPFILKSLFSFTPNQPLFSSNIREYALPLWRSSMQCDCAPVQASLWQELDRWTAKAASLLYLP